MTTRNLRLIAKTSFKRDGDVGLATIACEMLAKAGDLKDDNNAEMRLPTTDHIWSDLSDFITSNFQEDKDNLIGLLQTAINFIYKVKVTV